MSTEQQTSKAAQASSATTSIHSGTHIGVVTLRVANSERSRRFYEGIMAFQALDEAPGKVVLGGQDRQPLLELVEAPGAVPTVWATGLITWLSSSQRDQTWVANCYG